MKATCGHLEEKSFTNANDGLCRKCHSNFAFLLEIEAKGRCLIIIRSGRSRTHS